MTRAQTATEYLILIGVVIVIALILVSFLGEIPSLGGNSRADSFALRTMQVGVEEFYSSDAQTVMVMRNNEDVMIRIDSISLDDSECIIVGTHTEPTSAGTLSPGESKEVRCGSVASDTDFSYPIQINYTRVRDNVQISLDDDVRLSGRNVDLNCPSGFIPVPGGFVLADGSTVADFCVMKYEAKARVDAGGAIVADGGFSQSNNWGVATHTPVAVAEGRPWVRINQTNAIAECQSLGSGYDLISDRQWMTIAENILNTPINDLNESKSGVQLASGHSTGFGGSSIPSNQDENPMISGCNLHQSIDAIGNMFAEGNCELRGNGINSKGYFNTGNSFSDTFQGDRNQLRTHVLSNKEVIWDIGGNVHERTREIIAFSPNDHGGYDTVTDYSGIEWMRPFIPWKYIRWFW